MSTQPPFSDDPLPGMEPQANTPGAAKIGPEERLEQAAEGLHDPQLQTVGSYGRSDPASLAAMPSSDLLDPDLHLAAEVVLPPPDLQTTPQDSSVQTPLVKVLDKPPSKDFSNWDPHLAHLAQVGLVDADQWEEHIKPRIDQLHEDIDQINEQLDDLDKAKRTTKKS